MKALNDVEGEGWGGVIMEARWAACSVGCSRVEDRGVLLCLALWKSSSALRRPRSPGTLVTSLVVSGAFGGVYCTIVQ